jgi:hypothetical protein
MPTIELTDAEAQAVLLMANDVQVQGIETMRAVLGVVDKLQRAQQPKKARR